MEYAIIMSGGEVILSEHLPRNLREKSAAGAKPRLSVVSNSEPIPATARTLEQVEMEHVLSVLEKHNGSKTAAAAELGISLKTLYNKLNKLQEERKNAG